MKYTLYTGCMTPVTAPHYELSVKKVCDSLNIGLEPLKAPCCGNPLKVINAGDAVKMSLYVLGLASEKENVLMTLCSACNSSLLEAQKNIDNAFLDRLNFDPEKVRRLRIKHFINILHDDVTVKSLQKKIQIPLDMRAAVHYGCHFFRPTSLYHENPEYPTSLDELTEICGAHSIAYKHKFMCCGSPLLGVDFDLSLKMTSRKLEEIRNKADSMVITCSGCGFMFDGKQKSAESVINKPINIPVLYYSQVLGLALGIPPSELGFSMNRVRADALLEKVVP